MILDVLTSRELGMPEICPDNPLKLSEPQYTPREHSLTGISVILIVS